MRFTPSVKWLLPALVFLFLTTGCHRFISPFDQYAYTQTTALKVDVLELIDKSTEPYSSQSAAIENVTTNLMKAVEYEKHRPDNNITVAMWNRMIDSTRQNGIIGRYLSSWKKDGTKSKAFINEVKPQISRGFDLIADLESQKIKPSDASITTFLNK